MKPMSERQQVNVLYWIDEMMSGRYKHGKNKMYDPETGCYCAIGVALVSQFTGVKPDRSFVDPTEYGWASANQWFDVTFGLPRNATLYSTMSDMSTNYHTVIALLFHALPDSPRKQSLHRRFMEQVNEANKARV